MNKIKANTGAQISNKELQRYAKPVITGKQPLYIGTSNGKMLRNKGLKWEGNSEARMNDYVQAYDKNEKSKKDILHPGGKRTVAEEMDEMKKTMMQKEGRMHEYKPYTDKERIKLFRRME